MNETVLLVLLLLLSVEAVLLLAYRQNWSDKARRYRAHFNKERMLLDGKIKGLEASNESLRKQIALLNNEAVFDAEE